MSACRKAAGFTLIELMITLAILVIVVTIGVPSLTGFVAAQRVRAAASDLMADMALARAEAIKESRQAKVQLLTSSVSWKDGWRVCVITIPNAPSGWDCDSAGADVRKISPALPGDIKVCGVGTLPTKVNFRPDGRVSGAEDGIKISDLDGSTYRIRVIYLDVLGRPRMAVEDGGTPC